MVKFISPLISVPFKVQKHDQNFTIPPSLVTSGTPDFFPHYTRYLGVSGVWESLGPKLADSKNSNEPAWDVDVARFMLHLSALAYEHPDVVGELQTTLRNRHMYPFTDRRRHFINCSSVRFSMEA